MIGACGVKVYVLLEIILLDDYLWVDSCTQSVLDDIEVIVYAYGLNACTSNNLGLEGIHTYVWWHLKWPHTIHLIAACHFAQYNTCDW